MNTHSQSHCIACLEAIPANASICSHCGSAQSKSYWSRVAGFLKWVGGIATVISLVAGAIQLNSVVDDLQSKNRTVNNYLLAAQNQFQTGDYENAQLLLAQAARLDPYSEQVRELQIDFLMMEIHQYHNINQDKKNVATLHLSLVANGQKNYDWYRTTEKQSLKDYFTNNNTRETLALGAAMSFGKRKADILAHIAWLDLLIDGVRSDTEIDALFAKAQDIDPGNAFVRIMASAWLARDGNKKLSKQQKLSAVLENFRQIEKIENNQRLWLHSMQYEILNDLHFPEADIAMMRLVMAQREQNPFQTEAQMFLYALNRFSPDYNYRQGHKHDRYEASYLFDELKADELFDYTIWLGVHAFGCQAAPICDADIATGPARNFYESLGFLYEQTGQNARAFNLYKQLQITYLNAGHSHSNLLHKSLKRSLTQKSIPFIKASVVHQDSSDGKLKRGDIFLRIYQQSNIDNKIVSLMENNENGDTGNTVLLQKNGKLSLINFPGVTLSYNKIILPAEILLPETSQLRRQKLYRAWIGRSKE